MRDAIERKVVAYEFLGSAEPWEERWGTESQSYLLSLVYPIRINGAFALFVDGITVIHRRLTKYFFRFGAFRRRV